MRTHYIFVAILILLGVGLKVMLFSTVASEPNWRTERSVQVSQTQQNLPVEEFHDMTFVFPPIKTATYPALFE